MAPGPVSRTGATDEKYSGQHCGQERETIDKEISKGVTKEINRVPRQRELGSRRDSLGIWKDLLEEVLSGQRMRNEKELAAMCRAEERTFQAEVESKEARLAGWWWAGKVWKEGR